MSKRLLIVRSVSFQQLDLLLPVLSAAYPRHELHLLTHLHGVAIAKTYPQLSIVHGYPYRERFRFGRSLSGLFDGEFDAVVVPVANAGGGGYFNVLLFSFGLPARRRLICLPDGELSELTAVGLAGRVLRQAVLVPLAALLALPMVVAASVALPMRLWAMRSRGGEE